MTDQLLIEKIRAQAGVTLLELLIVVAMVAIMASLAAPSFTGTIARTQVSSTRDGMASALQYARSEALKRKTPVTVCTSSDQDSCSGSTDWQLGWIVYGDDDGNGTRDAAEPVLQVKYSESQVVTYGNAGTAITFDRIGRAIAGAGDFSFCHPKQETDGKQVSVSVTGSVERTHESISGC